MAVTSYLTICCQVIFTFHLSCISMLGLLLFISALAVLIICARMHDCHVLILWVSDSDTNYRKKNALKTWQANNKQARSIVCIAHLKGCLVIDVRLSDVTWQRNIIKSEIELWLWAVSSEHAPVRRYRTEKMPPKERKNQIDRYKLNV